MAVPLPIRALDCHGNGYNFFCSDVAYVEAVFPDFDTACASPISCDYEAIFGAVRRQPNRGAIALIFVTANEICALRLAKTLKSLSCTSLIWF
jgi:hypothetical protein